MEVSKFENDEFLACIDDLLDFSEDEITNPAGADVSKVEFPVGVQQKMVSPKFPAGDFAVQDSGDLYVPCDDLEELEWLSTFFEDCMPTASAGIPPKQSKPDKPAPALAGKPLKETTREEFRTSSPTSVLETTFPLMTPKPKTAFPRRETTIPARRRTKRPRPTFAKVCWSFPRIISRESSPENQSEEFSSGDEPQMPENNSGKRKLQPGKENTCEINRRCMHCAIQKTPQWRTGPMGPKTLCNACGVRYKSGRLLPEYRPAASPTFIPSRHSNSHRKVMEMRIKKWNKEKQEAPAEERLLLKPILDN